MPRFQITAEFDLVTSIEPELGRYSFDTGEVEDFGDDSYWQTEEVTSSGGSLRFTVEAEDADSAEQYQSVIGEGMEVEDSNGLTWQVENLRFETEKVEEPMTLERARTILTGLVTDGDDEEVREAVEFVFDHMTNLADQLRELDQRIATLSVNLQTAHDEVRRLQDAAVAAS